MANKSKNAALKSYLEHVDSKYGYEIAKSLLRFKTTEEGFRNAGTKAENDAADWITEEMKKIGLSNVTKESFDVDAWEFHGASVEIVDPENTGYTMKAGSFAGLEGTTPEGCTGQLVYVGEGTAACYEALDVTGKIVLIDTDAYYSYWYNLIFEEAQARGAIAIVAAITDRGPGSYRDDLITIQNIQGFVDIPAVILNKRDSEFLRTVVKDRKKLIVNIRADIKIRKKAEANCVYGMIEGKHPESLIIYSGHYDAYWDGFLDNASSLGTMMTIAKGMIESDYKPESTIIFFTNGAEEYGRMKSAYDYCIGSTAALKKHHEWIANTKMCFNFELTAHNQMDGTFLTVNGACKKWFEELLDNLDFVEHKNVIPTSSAGADNIVFFKEGVPVCMNVTTDFHGDNPESACNYDHTKYDCVERYNEVAFDHINKVYGALGYMIDTAGVMQFDFTKYLDDFWDNIDIDYLRSIYPKTDTLIQTLNQFKDACCRSVNIHNDFEDVWGINKALLEINKAITKELYKYNTYSEIIIGHHQPYSYVKGLKKLITGLKDGKTDELETFLGVDYNYLVSTFSKEVYKKTVIDAFADEDAMVWAKGNIIKFPDIYDVIASIIKKIQANEKHFDEEIAVLNTIQDEQIAVLCDVLDHELQIINDAKEIMENDVNGKEQTK